MTAATLAQPRLWRVEIETLIRSDGFVVMAQRDEVGAEQLIIVERVQLRDLAASVERTFRNYEKGQLRSEAKR